MRIHLFGRFRVLDRSGAEIEFPTHSSAALLAMLALQVGQRSARQALSQKLWPDKDPQSAAGNFRLSLWRARKALGDAEDAIQTYRDKVWLDPEAVWIDLDVYRANGHAGLLTGTLLDGWDDEWALEERARFQAQVDRSLWQQAAVAFEAGQYRKALTLAGRVAADDPLREDAHRMVMAAYLALGEATAAIQQYLACASALETELGVEPSPETKGLAARAGRAAASSATGAPEAAPPAPGLFVGRRAEVTALSALVQGAGPHQALVVGEPGIGKTTLMNTVLAVCRPVTVLSVACHDSGSPPPYQLLAEIMRSLSPEFLRAAGDGVQNALRLLLPELGAPVRTTPGEDRHRLITACTELLREASAVTRLVVAIDDLQWSDPASLAALESIWPRLSGAVLLGTCRSDAFAERDDIAGWVDRGAAAGRLVLIPLKGLSEAETAELGEALCRTGAPPSSGPWPWLYQESGGNPLLITELVRTGDPGQMAPPATTPPVIVRTMRGRLVGLSDEAREVLRAAAVLGQSFQVPDLCAMVGLPEFEALSAIEELTVRGLLVEEALGYRFYHAKFREVVLGEMSLARRQALHRAAARVVRNPSLVAHHAEQGLDWRLAADALVRAGDDATKLAAKDDAIALFSRAVQAASHDRLALYDDLTAALWGRAEVLSAVGRLREMADDLDALEQLANLRGDRTLLVRVAGSRTQLVGRMGDPEAGLAEGRRAILLCDHPDVPPHEVARVHLIVARLYWRLGRDRRYRQEVETALAWAQRSDHQLTQAWCLIELATLQLQRGRYEQLLRYAKEACRITLRLGELGWHVSAQTLVCRYHLAAGNFQEALTLHQAGVDQARRWGNRSLVGFELSTLAMSYRRAGRLREAAAPARESCMLAAEIGDTKMLVWAKRELAFVTLDEGDPGGALALADEALAYAALTGDATDRDSVQEARIRALLALGRLDEAVAWARAQRPWHPRRIPVSSFAICTLAAEVLVRAGLFTEAHRWLRPMRKWRLRLNRFAPRIVLIRSLMVEAEVTGDDAVREQAVQIAEACGLGDRW
jgi:DNA-binding SARP family transcriptional activator